MEFSIRLNSLEDAVKLANRLEYYNCQAEVWYDNYVIDARSWMGLLRFGIGKVVQVKMNKITDVRLCTEIKEFVMA